MKNLILFYWACFLCFGCTPTSAPSNQSTSTPKNIKNPLNHQLPTIGILVFDGVIMNEVLAPIDVFAQPNTEGSPLFNVLTIGKTNKIYQTAHGLSIIPDVSIDECPELDVLVIPSSYTPEQQTQDQALIQFIQEQHQHTSYIASHCAGAFLVGEAGIAPQKNIVTYVTGGQHLQQAYPNLKVANDSLFAVVEDGKFISSNGSLVSYPASLNLLEKMTSSEHRKYVEETLLLNKLQSF